MLRSLQKNVVVSTQRQRNTKVPIWVKALAAACHVCVVHTRNAVPTPAKTLLGLRFRKVCRAPYPAAIKYKNIAYIIFKKICIYMYKISLQFHVVRPLHFVVTCFSGAAKYFLKCSLKQLSPNYGETTSHATLS